MDFIKLARLKSGEDLICFVELGKSVVRIIYPVSVYMSFDEDENQNELNLSFWLPVELLTKNQVTIPLSEVLFFADPKPDFAEFYLNYLTEFEHQMEDSDFNEIKSLLDTFNTSSKKLH